MKSWGYIIIFVIVIVGISGVILYNVKTIDDIDSEVVVIDGSDAKRGGLIYQNNDLGYQLTMTEGWSDYSIKGTVDDVDFCVYVPETLIPSNPVCFFRIIAIDANERDQEIKECEKNNRWMEEDCHRLKMIQDRELGRKDGKIFVYVIANDSGEEKEKPFVDDIDKILNSFQFLD